MAVVKIPDEDIPIFRSTKAQAKFAWRLVRQYGLKQVWVCKLLGITKDNCSRYVNKKTGWKGKKGRTKKRVKGDRRL